MSNMKLYNIQKESEKIKIKKIINDCEDLKAQALLKLGVMTYDKIRKGNIVDEDFNSLCDEIKDLDIEIYTKYMQLRNFENENKRNTCQCGYVAFKNEKFCPQCGKSLLEEEQLYVTCSNCDQETEKDSNFCACCGSKITQELDSIEDFGKEFLKHQEEIVAEEYDSEDNIAISEEDIEDSIEIEGREFLKNYQKPIEE